MIDELNYQVSLSRAVTESTATQCVSVRHSDSLTSSMRHKCLMDLLLMMFFSLRPSVLPNYKSKHCPLWELGVV